MVSWEEGSLERILKNKHTIRIFSRQALSTSCFFFRATPSMNRCPILRRTHFGGDKLRLAQCCACTCPEDSTNKQANNLLRARLKISQTRFMVQAHMFRNRVFIGAFNRRPTGEKKDKPFKWVSDMFGGYPLFGFKQHQQEIHRLRAGPT